MLNKIRKLFLELGYRNQNPPNMSESERQISPREGEWFASLVKITSARNILEFGTWQGRSALSWVNALKEQNLSPEESCVVCVDTWLGSWEHILDFNSQSEWGRLNLKLVNGRPMFYDEFVKEMSEQSASQYVYPFSGTTETAHQVFKRLGVKFDIIYIDASHDYLPVTRDLFMATELLSPRGLIVGDDFETWKSVREAVLDFADELGLKVMVGFGQYLILPRQDNLELIAEFEQFGWSRIDTFSQREPKGSNTTIRYLLYYKEEELRQLKQEHDLVLNSRIWILAGNYARLKKKLLRKL